MTENFATAEATKQFTEKFPSAAPGFFRESQGLQLSSVGIGTYLGNWDAETDQGYTQAIVRFVELGGNVIDTAANYRFQRSERNIGAALEILQEKGFNRSELLICTKGGYLPFDTEPPQNVRQYFEETFVKTRVATFDDLAAGSHCMTPNYLQSQIDQSLRNLKLAGVDVYYIHNPESQLGEVDKNTFEARLAKAFEKLEENRAAGKLQFYGAATWNGFRVSPQETSYHSLERMFNIARQVGGEDHGFKFIQLPFNLALPEAFAFSNQQFNGKLLSSIEVAANLGISVMCSGSLMQGKIAAATLPVQLRQSLGDLPTDAQTGIQFVRSAPGVMTALIGMSKTGHVEENMNLVQSAPLNAEQYDQLFGQE